MVEPGKKTMFHMVEAPAELFPAKVGHFIGTFIPGFAFPSRARK